MNVAQQLYNMTSQITAPGTVGKCLGCGEDTFVVASNDEIGRCHKCFYEIKNDAHTPGKLAPFQKFINQLALAFCISLWNAADRFAADARQFLIETLGFDEALLRGFGIGFVPENLNTKKLIALVPEVSDDPSQNPREEIEIFLDHLKVSAGCVAFPYTDAYHNITGWSVIAIDGKRRCEHRIQPGCFGHSGAHVARGNMTPATGRRPLIVADSLHWLRIQNAMLAAGYDPQTGCATGSFANTAWNVLDHLSGPDCQRPVIVADKSLHPAIRLLAGAAQENLTIDAFEFDRSCGSVEQAFGADQKPPEIIAAIEQAVANSRPLFRPHENIAQEIYGIRLQNAGVSGEVVAHSQIAALLIRELRRRGQFLRSGDFVYWLDSETLKFVDLAVNEDEFMRTMARLRVMKTENIYRYVGSRLAAEAYERGRVVTLRRFAHWDDKLSTLHIDLRNGQMLRMDGIGAPTVAVNGDGGVLFIPIPEAAPINFNSEAPAKSLWAATLFDMINFTSEGALTPGDRRLLLLIYVLQLFFISLAPTKPVCAFVGMMGSGKSATGKAIGKVLFGPDFNAATVGKQRDIETHITNSYFAFLDNADDCPDRIDDLIAVAATGGTIKKRQLFKTNTLLSFPLDCFIMTSSQRPKFKRQDLADRTLPCRTQRMETFLGEAEFNRLIADRRDGMWVEMIDSLNAVVKLLKETPAGTQRGKLRLADFYDFGLRILTGMGLGSYWTALMPRLIHDQVEFSTSGNPIYECLKSWIAADKNCNRPMKTVELYDELTAIATKNNLFWKYSGAQSFGQYLAGMLTSLEQFFDVRQWVAHGGTKYYAFNRKTKTTVADAGDGLAPVPVNPDIKSPLLLNLYRYVEQAAQERQTQQDRENLIAAVSSCDTKADEPKSEATATSDDTSAWRYEVTPEKSEEWRQHVERSKQSGKEIRDEFERDPDGFMKKREIQREADNQQRAEIMRKIEEDRRHREEQRRIQKEEAKKRAREFKLKQKQSNKPNPPSRKGTILPVTPPIEYSKIEYSKDELELISLLKAIKPGKIPTAPAPITNNPPLESDQDDDAERNDDSDDDSDSDADTADSEPKEG